MRQARRWPSRAASCSATGVAAIIVRIRGRFARPARIGLQPYAYWKCRIRPNMTLAMVTEAPSWVIAAPRAGPVRKIARSIIGDSAWRSRRTKPTTATTVPTAQATVSGESQPCSTPLVRV